jgi:hypothetical protein
MVSFVEKMMGVMMEGMEGMMRHCQDAVGEVSESARMPSKMTEMMPRCLNIIMPRLTKERRAEFALKMARVLSEQGSAEMTDAESEVFLSELSAAIREGVQRSPGQSAQ